MDQSLPQEDESHSLLAPKPFHIRSPLITSQPLSSLTGISIFLKMEACQPTGSFKVRGLGLACQEAVAKGAKHLIASSGGNAGLAVAYAGKLMGIPVTVL